MYLTTTRLVSLLVSLVVLTFALLWLLSKQAISQTAIAAQNSVVQVVAAEPTISTNTNPAAATESKTVNIDKQSTTGANTPTATQANAVKTFTPAQAAAAQKAEEVKTANATQSAPATAIPANFTLSEKELKALSSKERQRYEEMLKNLRTIREQSAQLDAEQVKLQQQVKEMEQRNQELTEQLEQKTAATATGQNVPTALKP